MIAVLRLLVYYDLASLFLFTFLRLIRLFRLFPCLRVLKRPLLQLFLFSYKGVLLQVLAGVPIRD